MFHEAQIKVELVFFPPELDFLGLKCMLLKLGSRKHAMKNKLTGMEFGL